MIRLIVPACLILGTVAGFQAIAWGYSWAMGREGIVRRPSTHRGEPLETVPLIRGTKVVQRFQVDEDHWVGFGARTVTWGHFPRPGRCSWVLYECRTTPGGPRRAEVRRGSFRASRLRDRTIFPVRFPEIARSAGRTYELEFSGPDVEPGEAVGLPIYRGASGAGAARVRVESQRPGAGREAPSLVPPADSGPMSLDLERFHRPGRSGDGRVAPG